MIQTFFNNIETNIVRTIASAEKRIYVAVAWFTNQFLFDALIDALRKNIEVKVIVLNDLVNRNEFGLDFGILIEKGADVKMALSNKGLMHHKFCIIDNKVITGSYNWTYRGNINNENIVIIDEPDIANIYCEQFNAIFSIADIVKLPYKRFEWTDVKEEDYSEFHNNIFLDIEAQSNPNKELRQNKLRNLNVAFKSGNAEELAAASSLPIKQKLRTISDVLTSRSQDFTLKLWEENNVGKPYDNSVGYIDIGKWWYIPNAIKEDKYHREYIEGVLKSDKCKDKVFAKGLYLEIFDEEYIAATKQVLCSKTLSVRTRNLIPDSMLQIDMAKMFYYQFPSPMFNKSQPRTWGNSMPRTISAINLLGIVKEIDGEKIIFYEGWDPNERGKLIQENFFTKS